MALFGSSKEAEEKYNALLKEKEELEAQFGELETEAAALRERVEKLQAEQDAKLEEFKADLEEKLTLAIEAGIATPAAKDVLFAATVKDAALETVKAVKSEGATVATTQDVEPEEDVERAEAERIAAIEAAVKKTLGVE